MRFACWIIKAKDTHSEYVIVTVFPRQQWSRKIVSRLRYMYFASLVVLESTFPLLCTDKSFWVRSEYCQRNREYWNAQVLGTGVRIPFVHVRFVLSHVISSSTRHSPILKMRTIYITST
jgi:hypothetical protein